MNLIYRINWLNPLVLTLGFILIVGIIKGVQPLLYWPVEGVRVVGSLEHVDRSRLQYALAGTLSAGFLASDLDDVKAAVEALPWVDSAHVKRLWPEQIEIALTEKMPLANWLQNGFLDSNLAAFYPAKRSGFEELPKLAGPEGTEKVVWEFYQTLSRQLKPLGLKVDVVSMARHGAWSVHLENGPWILLGKEQTEERRQRLDSALASLQERWTEVRLVDMRYPNGFSVEWTQ